MIKLSIPPALRNLTGNKTSVTVAATTVLEAIEIADQRHPGLKAAVLSESLQVRRFISIYVGEQDIRELAGLASKVPDKGSITILTAMAGG
jgi:molybdopterin converting factor small subunit